MAPHVGVGWKEKVYGWYDHQILECYLRSSPRTPEKFQLECSGQLLLDCLSRALNCNDLTNLVFHFSVQIYGFQNRMNQNKNIWMASNQGHKLGVDWWKHWCNIVQHLAQRIIYNEIVLFMKMTKIMIMMMITDSISKNWSYIIVFFFSGFWKWWSIGQ